MGWLIVGAALLPACSASAVPSSSVELPPGSNLESTASTSEPDTVPEATLPFPYDGDCEYMNMKVDAPLEAAEGAFTVSPFDLSTIRMFINGSEGNGGTDPRFSYVLIEPEGARIPIYAPAPMLLVRLRPKDGFSMGRTREDGDWDLTFVTSCNVWVRINHITEPSDEIRSAYGFGDEPATYWLDSGEQVDDESKMNPVFEVRLEPGDLIGYTQGTASANFDFVVGIDGNSVCPWEVFEEPVRSELLAKLGPPPDRPSAGPVPGWPCVGYGAPM
jgi:hypothetical protein